MRTDLFHFELPAASIALRPASPRDSARMLVVQPDDVLRDRVIADLPLWLEPGDQLVVNDTKVIAAQLTGRRIGRDTEPRIEATLIKRLDGSRWQALVRPARKLAAGDTVRFGNEGKVCLLGHLDAEVEAKGDDGEVTLSFSFHGPALDAAIADLGHPPLPPYIASKRTPDDRDLADYQTMFAAKEGAVAAPTAGLHFTPALEAALRGHGVGLHRLTLHVGAGTFLPVKTDDTGGHKMHAEWGSISVSTAAALNAARADGGRDSSTPGPLNLSRHEAARKYVDALENPDDAHGEQRTPDYVDENPHGLLLTFLPASLAPQSQTYQMRRMPNASSSRSGLRMGMSRARACAASMRSNGSR